MKILTLEDFKKIVNCELMQEIYLEIEFCSLYAHMTYAYDGVRFYRLGDKGWNSIYVNKHEDFYNYVERNSPFYDGSSLVRLK